MSGRHRISRSLIGRLFESLKFPEISCSVKKPPVPERREFRTLSYGGSSWPLEPKKTLFLPKFPVVSRRTGGVVTLSSFTTTQRYIEADIEAQRRVVDLI